MLNIKYDIVGSFLRPQEIKEARAKFNNNEITYEQLRDVEDEQIAKLVAKEVQHGLKFVTDGEFRRRWWHLDWLKEFDGFTTKHLDKFINGRNNHIELGMIEGKISYDPNKAHKEMYAWDFLKNEASKYGVEAKKCISGPNMILIDHFLQLGIKDTPYYGTDIEAVIDDIGLAYQAAIRDFYNHGCRYIQIDDTSWTYMIDDTSADEFSKLEENIVTDGEVREPLVVWHNTIIDGHHRYKIVQKICRLRHTSVKETSKEIHYSTDFMIRLPSLLRAFHTMDIL